MLSISKAFNFRNLRISNLLGLRKCQILNSGLIEANQTILRLPGRAPSVSLVAGYQSEASRRHYDGPRKKKARKSKEIVDIDLLHLDIDNPHLWYRDARALKRRVICHLGPTNSGKTFHALEHLSRANSGVYCGPLRLLAWEVYEKLNEKGIKCNLVTGNEKDLISGARHQSCTVEMIDINKNYDVAIIDEMQLIGDSSRGWAFTQAFLGLQADVIYVCGSLSMKPVVEALCNNTNDIMEIVYHERLLPLKISDQAIATYNDIRDGDAVVAFSRRSLYEIKERIEKLKKKNNCCVIYGSLPPIARKDQAKLFSDPTSNFNCLVATDAIGMGLNLSIRRIIFSTMTKYDGNKHRPLYPSEVKQIAGRAGRYNSIYKEGEVTCLERADMHHLRRCLATDDKPIRKAGLFPSIEQLSMLAFIYNYKITNNMIRDFWFEHLHGVDIDMPMDEEVRSMYAASTWRNIGTILSYFPTIYAFTASFVRFLTSHPVYGQQYVYEEDLGSIVYEDMAAMQSAVHDSQGWDIRSSDKSNDSNGSILASTDKSIDVSFQSKNGDVSAMRNLSDSNMKPNREKIKIKRRNKRNVLIIKDNNDLFSSISLRYLLESFKQEVEMDKKDCYFICNFDESLVLANIVDEYRQILSLQQRYLLCKAPVNIDDREVREAFKSFIQDYCAIEKVSCPDYNDAMSILPTTDEDIMKFETIHSILDLYIWLAWRIPTSFHQIDEAKEQSSKCSNVINNALISLKYTAKNKRSKTNRYFANQFAGM